MQNRSSLSFSGPKSNLQSPFNPNPDPPMWFPPLPPLSSRLPRPPSSKSTRGRGTAENKVRKVPRLPAANAFGREPTVAGDGWERGLAIQNPGLGRLGAPSLRLRCRIDPRPSEEMLGKEAVGLSHGVERGLGRIRKQAHVSFLSGSSRLPSRARQRSPPAQTEQRAQLPLPSRYQW